MSTNIAIVEALILAFIFSIYLNNQSGDYGIPLLQYHQGYDCNSKPE